MIKYAGIGARETPSEILVYMRTLGRFMASKGILRSGGAPGADVAFEAGCTKMGGTKEIYLPYKNFNGSVSELYYVSPEARALARKYHPNWPNLGDTGRNFMARNAYQLLGLGLDDPVDFIVCWTFNGKTVGGTGQALRMAPDYNIPIFNMAVMNLSAISNEIQTLIG